MYSPYLILGAFLIGSSIILFNKPLYYKKFVKRIKYIKRFITSDVLLNFVDEPIANISEEILGKIKNIYLLKDIKNFIREAKIEGTSDKIILQQIISLYNPSEDDLLYAKERIQLKDN